MTPLAAHRCVVIAIAMTLLYTLTGCQSNAQRPSTACRPARGMATSELAKCGCFSASNQSRYTIGESPSQTGRQVQTVSMLTYICPSEAKGFSRVMVVNGIATEVFE